MTFRMGLIGTIDHASFVTDLGIGANSALNVELTGVFEPDAAKAKALADRWGATVHDTKQALLDSGVDAVGIFGPYDEKAADVTAAVERGIHVLADKPIAIRAEEVTALRDLCAKHSDVVATMALSLRIEQPYVKVRELLRSGVIGTPAVIRMRRAYRLKRDQRPAFMFDSSTSGGLWVELAVHDIDYLCWLTGEEIIRVSATHGNVSYPGEPFQDHAAGLFVLASGTTALIEQNRLVPAGGPGSDNRLSVVGSQGTIEMVGSDVTLWSGDKGPEAVDVGPTDWSQLFVNFVAAARAEAELLAPTADVLRATDASLAAYKSAQVGGRMVNTQEKA